MYECGPVVEISELQHIVLRALIALSQTTVNNVCRVAMEVVQFEFEFITLLSTVQYHPGSTLV